MNRNDSNRRHLQLGTEFVRASRLRSFPLSTNDLLCPEDELCADCRCALPCRYFALSNQQTVVITISGSLCLLVFLYPNAAQGYETRLDQFLLPAKPIEYVNASPTSAAAASCNDDLLITWRELLVEYVRALLAAKGRSCCQSLPPPAPITTLIEL